MLHPWVEVLCCFKRTKRKQSFLVPCNEIFISRKSIGSDCLPSYKCRILVHILRGKVNFCPLAPFVLIVNWLTVYLVIVNCLAIWQLGEWLSHSFECVGFVLVLAVLVLFLCVWEYQVCSGFRRLVESLISSIENISMIVVCKNTGKRIWMSRLHLPRSRKISQN